MYLAVGLGNPGKEFENTKHNAGFEALKVFAKEHKIPLSPKRKYDSNMGEAVIGQKKIILLMPHTFMNNSGKAVSRTVKTHKLPPENIIVVHDELDLAFGVIKIKKGGSSAGHNGLQSIINECGTKDFIRIRIGIGRPASTDEKKDTVEYVLSKVPRAFHDEYKTSIEKAAEAIEEIVVNGYAKAMNHFNRAAQ